MQYTVPPLLSAPLVTGHPLGLPGERPDRADQSRVKPVADARDPRTELRDGKSPAKFWRAVNGTPDPNGHAAPPSIMQITISRMLDEQKPEQEAAAQSTEAEPAQGASEHASRESQPTVSKEARSSVFSTLP